MEEETKINNTVHIVEEKEQETQDDAKWVTHYSSDHQILLVGEGDFSFSLSLAKTFGSADNIVASSLDSYDDVTKMYKNAKSNLDDLHKLGACLLHGVDATEMKLHSYLKMRRFDRVIFNFPHAGFHAREDNTLLIKMHEDLVLRFFKNASSMLRANGEIHVSHKTTAPFSNWNIPKLAEQCLLTLIECADFKREDYPGYHNKRGDGYRRDEPFPLGKCCTYKFIYNPKAKHPKAKQKRHKKGKERMVFRQQTSLTLEEIENAVEKKGSVHLNYYPQPSLFPKLEEAVPSIFGLTNRCNSISGYHLSNMAEVHGNGRVAPYGGYSALGMSQGSSRPSQPIEPLEYLQPWRPTSTNVRYSLTDPLSFDPRNEGYHQVYGGGRSNYLQEQLGRTLNTVPSSLGTRNEGYQVYAGRPDLQELGRTTAQRANDSFDEVRSDFERQLLKWLERML